MKHKDLALAVRDVIIQFYINSRSFSAYQVTEQIRKEVNSKCYALAGYPYDSAATIIQFIPHSDVRKEVEECYTKGWLTRTQGTKGYYLYSAAGKTSPNHQHDAIFNAIKDYLEGLQYVNVKDLTYGTKVEDLLLDDLDVVELLMHIEEAFRKELNNQELDTEGTKFVTLNDIIEYVANAIKGVVKNPQKAPTSTDIETKIKKYLDGRMKKNVKPTLKNVQKSLKVPGISLMALQTRIKQLGYSITGDRSQPFNQWVVSK